MADHELTKHELARLHFKRLAERASSYCDELSPGAVGEETFEAFDQEEWGWAISIAEDWRELAKTIEIYIQRRGKALARPSEEAEQLEEVPHPRRILN